MIMKQQGFNFRVLMSVALSALFLGSAVNGMEDDDVQINSGQFKGYDTLKSRKLKEQKVLKQQLKNKQKKFVVLGRVAAISRDDGESTRYDKSN